MQTLPAMLARALERERSDLLVERVDDRWTPTSSARLRERVRNIALGLRDLGVEAGAHVALIAPNSVDWIAADLGILFAGCVVVPIFATQALDQVRFILEHSGSRAVIVDTAGRARTLREQAGVAAPIIAFDDPEHGLPALERRGAEIAASRPGLAQDYASSAAPGDLAVLIYTSGTTGEPKGVMLSHRNLVTTTLNAFAYAFPALTGGDHTLTILPFAHIYEHIVLYGKLTRAVSLHLCRDGTGLLRDLRDVRPVLMTAVPRIFEHVLAGIVMKARSGGGLRARIVPWALAAGREYVRASVSGRVPLGLRLRYALARAFVLRKLRPMLGLDRLTFIVSGSAPLHVDVALTFAAAGIEIVEGYGTTECSPVITVNRAEDNRYGTVGKSIPRVEIRLAPDGEILVRGPGVMLGYYKDDAANGAVFEGEWYKTGDIGELDADGYLRIVDRKKELFKTTSGKFIAPTRIESALMRSPYVAQAVVVAEGRDAPAALIWPKWEYIADRDAARSLIRRQLSEYTKDLAPYEQVHRFSFLPRELTIEDGELSPTLKIRRRVVESRYGSLLEE